MKYCVVTDMEGLCGVSSLNECSPKDKAAYRYGLEQLAGDTNAAVAGLFDSGATEVIVWDGHGDNDQCAFEKVALDPRASFKTISDNYPRIFGGLDHSARGLVIIGQHAMAGTIGGFLDHTRGIKDICRFLINGEEHGEISHLALMAGYYGVPLIYVSGDDAACREAKRLFPHVGVTPTKRGTGWETVELYPSEQVRPAIRKEIALAAARAGQCTAWKPRVPIDIMIEFSWSGLPDRLAQFPGVRRDHARIVSWKISDPRHVYQWPSKEWHPL